MRFHFRPRGGSCAALALVVLVAAGLTVPASETESSAGSDPATRIAPRALDGAEPDLEPGHDIERGPAGDPEEFRRLTQFTEAEVNAVDPFYRDLVHRIRTGQADKRVMRAYWFLRSRLDPFDRPIPENWRRDGLVVLRDEARTRDAIVAFEARRGETVVPPAGSVEDASRRLRDVTAGQAQETTAIEATGIATRGVWVPIGPYTIPGRMTGLDRPADEPDTLYASAADGGVWRTRDRGQTWEPLSDFEATLSGGAVVLDPTDPQTIYFGTGEGNAAGDNYPGIGVLKSTDGGRTWVESNNFSNVVRALAIHPSNPSRIYAAGQHGCYRSDDAGLTFDPISAPGLPSGTRASTVLIRPDNPDWVYCAIWGGADSGIYRTTDGGASWAAINDGLPGGNMGRIAMAISKSNPDTLVAGVDVSGGWVHRSDDGGNTWTALGGGNQGYCGGQCWYDNVVGIDSDDPNVLYAGGVSAYRSLDGGAAWFNMSSGVHVDQHYIFTPASGEVVLANDGGVYWSGNEGGNFEDWGIGLDTTQYYGICRHPTEAYWVFGGTQDNGSHRRREGDVPEWQRRLGADGGMCMTGPPGSNVVVGEYQYTNIRRSTNDGNSFVSANGGIPQSDPKSWVGILVADPSNRFNMYAGTHRVYRSQDARASFWDAISSTLYPGSNVSAIEVAPTDSDRVYVGFVSGGLFRTDDATAPSPTWTDIRSGTMPLITVRRLRVHPGDPDTVYLAYSGYGSGRIRKTIDAGATWTDISGDLPNVPVNDLRLDPANPGTILAATDLGVFRTDDDGTTWYGFSSGLPTVASIEFTHDDPSGTLRLGTHGRSMWEWQAASETPVAVPDGATAGGDAMTVDRLGTGEMRVRWDVRSCTAQDYNLFYGDLDDVESRTYLDAVCNLGTSGIADVPYPVTPSGNAFFVVAAMDSAGTEGPHGYDDDGFPVTADGVGQCGVIAQDTAATCP